MVCDATCPMLSPVTSPRHSVSSAICSCTIFVAKHPVTKPNVNIIRRHEKNLDEKIEEMVKTALETDELIVVQ